jgi:hypothetical protein
MGENEVGSLGARPSGQALVASDEARAGLHPSGFDPSRVREIYEAEMLTLWALTDAWERGRLPYMHYEPAWDVTAARAAALSWLLLRDSDRTPTSEESHD